MFALVAVSVPLAEPVWDWASLEKLPSGPEDFGDCVVRGYDWTNRWTGEIRRKVRWYEGTGFMALKWSARHGSTVWARDGSLSFQVDDSDLRTDAPWLGVVSDQTRPTAPWWKGEK